MKNIVICADGTWNRPEEDLSKDNPTNVLKIARSISSVAADGTEQVVFYDWGLGSYHDGVSGGAFGSGINKNIQDCYRFIVQNYAPGDRLFFFGYSRGAFTVRSLAGLMNSAGILKRSKANLIARAFKDYKDPDLHPSDAAAESFRQKHGVRVKVDQLSVDERRAYTDAGDPKVHFIGVWDTVGALGVPLSMLSFLNREHMFHDEKIGSNIVTARHAMGIDEKRDDFKPTIWKHRPGVDIQQVWFAGCHGDIGGGNDASANGALLSDYPLAWVADEAKAAGLTVEDHLYSRLKRQPDAPINESYTGKWKLAGRHTRAMGDKKVSIHRSVKEKFEADGYMPDNLKKRVGKPPKWGDLIG